MTPRDEILASIRRHRREPLPLPVLEENWLDPPDRIGHFCQMVDSVGGAVVRVGESEVPATIERDPHYQAAVCVYSRVRGIDSRALSSGTDEILRGERRLDVAIVPSPLAVAENAAVYLPAADRVEHALLFLCEHLLLVVHADSVVANMHEAYRRLIELEAPVACPASAGGFAVFISGPSKTADIEQALVIGAQGPRSLTILLADR